MLGPWYLGRQKSRESRATGPLATAEGQAAGADEQLERVVDASQHTERFEHTARLFGALAPVLPGEHLFGDALARAEAIVADATGKATLVEPLVDTTAIVASEVLTGDARGLVEGKVARLVERQADTAQGGATVASGAELWLSHGGTTTRGCGGRLTR